MIPSRYGGPHSRSQEKGFRWPRLVQIPLRTLKKNDLFKGLRTHIRKRGDQTQPSLSASQPLPLSQITSDEQMLLDQALVCARKGSHIAIGHLHHLEGSDPDPLPLSSRPT